MKSIRTIVILSLCLLAITLLILTTIRQKEVTSDAIVLNSSINHATNPAGHPGFKRTVRFEPNLGQTKTSASYIARGNGYCLFIKPTEAVIAFQNSVKHLQLEGSNPDPLIRGSDELTGKTNYFIGNDPAKWITNIPNYAKLEYKEVYSGIDLVYYGNEGELEYDFIVAPGGNPHNILLKFDKQEKPRVNSDGSLVISDGKAEMIMKPPMAYQEKKGTRDSVFAEYSIRNDNLVGFNIGNYDPEFPLIIDPVLVYSTYLGTNDFESGEAIAVDAQGCAYVTGFTVSLDFPVENCFQCDMDPGEFLNYNVFVTKFNAEGTDIVYSTYIGGRSR